jgi:ribosomal protein S12 methylthiotransferase accessory factor
VRPPFSPPGAQGTIGDEAGRKVYLDGTHRIVDPAATLDRVLPMAASMGITRLAVLTGLDVVGIPVAAAYRPNSRSISVHQGKGTTLLAAKASALMEAAECWHAEAAVLPLWLATRDEIARRGRAVDPARLPLTGQGDPRTERLLWTEADDLASGGKLWVPYELVGADYTVSALHEPGFFQATTNGLASGNHWLEAVLHGLYEVVERDAVALWHAMPPSGQEARTLDPATVDGQASAGLLARFAAAKVDVAIWDVTSDVGLPAFLALASGAGGVAGVEPELGAGCHADRDVALSRALAEAAQARLTRISGARDDFVPETYAQAARARRHAAAEQMLRMKGRRDFADSPSCAGATLRHDLDAVLERLRQAGFDQVAAVDLSRPEIGLSVVRIIVPGLEGPWETDGEYMAGPRARAAAA